jgi:hypothetical protein
MCLELRCAYPSTPSSLSKVVFQGGIANDITQQDYSTLAPGEQDTMHRLAELAHSASFSRRWTGSGSTKCVDNISPLL